MYAIACGARQMRAIMRTRFAKTIDRGQVLVKKQQEGALFAAKGRSLCGQMPCQASCGQYACKTMNLWKILVLDMPG
jgi:hypothetical protein